MIKKIGVFCSASDSIDAIYFEKARQLGEWMGQENKVLVYGGTALGLMEQIAGAVKENG
ncbi:TIGR00730 family Rossman fold protein, partial [termite gut metagenome]